jgi:Rrf2 family protein
MTRETDYALRTVLYLARQAPESTVSTAALSVSMRIPYRFLRKIVAKLVTAGLVRSRRGKGGGLCLASDAAEISLLTVVKATEPNIVQLNECLVDAARCSRSACCVVHEELGRIQSALSGALASVTFRELVAREAANGAT